MNDLYTYPILRSDVDRALADYRARKALANPNCKRCGGLGHYPVANGPEDFEEVACGCIAGV